MIAPRFRQLIFASVALALPLSAFAQEATNFTPADGPTEGTVDAPRERVTAEPTPDALQATLALGQSALLPSDNSTVVMVELKGAEGLETARTPVSMAVVIDTSGSMRGDKIDNARDSAHALVDQLVTGDVISIITYDTRTTTIVSNLEIGEDRNPAHRAINDIEARGNTCVSCGIQAGYSALTSAPVGHVRRLVMLSDGNANRGVTNPGQLGELAGQALELSQTVSSTIGVGRDYNEDILSSISASGTGSFYFLPNPSSIDHILTRELASLATTVATGVAVELRPAAGVILGDSPSRGASREGTSVVFNIGQISEGEILRLIVPVTVGSEISGVVVEATAAYRPVGELSQSTDLVAMMIRTTDPQEAQSSRNETVIEHAERVASALDVELALQEFRSGDEEGAVRRLRSRRSQLESQATAYGNAVLADEANEVEQLLGELEDDDVDEERSRDLQLQNRSRREEVTSGRPAEQMYHDSAIVE